MSQGMTKTVSGFSICLFMLAGCNAQGVSPVEALTINLLYPTPNTQVVMGQTIKGIIKVTDASGDPVPEAEVILRFSNPNGLEVETVSADFGEGDVYRTEALQIPHRQEAGTWKIEVAARAKAGYGNVSQSFFVKDSTSEILEDKYGFWIDAPTLMGIVPNIVAERGDARNGLIRWGGQIPTQHVFPENWVEIQWREGDFGFENADDARRFMLEDLGDIGFTPIREISPFERFQFKDWKGWRATARGQLSYYDIEWVIFYASEVDKTYALGTTVVQPPAGVEAHDLLRRSFEVDAERQVNGIAPEPLRRLLPGPLQLNPVLGSRFFGLDQPIVLQWQPVKELMEDEYYQVSVDYNYAEGNFLYKFAMQETQFVLPEWMYREPNCGVFNWKVALMQQTGTDKNGQPVGEQLSYNSLYWYVEWLYPVGQELPFSKRCPNAQY